MLGGIGGVETLGGIMLGGVGEASPSPPPVHAANDVIARAPKLIDSHLL